MCSNEHKSQVQVRCVLQLLGHWPHYELKVSVVHPFGTPEFTKRCDQLELTISFTMVCAWCTDVQSCFIIYSNLAYFFQVQSPSCQGFHGKGIAANRSVALHFTVLLMTDLWLAKMWRALPKPFEGQWQNWLLWLPWILCPGENAFNRNILVV